MFLHSPKESDKGGRKIPLFLFVISENNNYLWKYKETLMITQLFDLTVYLNNKQLSIINSDMKIHLEWNVDLEKSEHSSKLKYTFIKLYGTFTLQDNKILYKKQSVYTFSTDQSWKTTHIPYDTDTISPTSAILNFDDKSVKIKF